MTSRDIYFWTFAACFLGMVLVTSIVLWQRWTLLNDLDQLRDSKAVLRMRYKELTEQCQRLREYIEKHDREGWSHEPAFEFPEAPSVGKHHIKETG